MEIKLYQLTSEKTRVDKTLFLDEELILTGTLRAPTSVLNPVLNLNYSVDILLYNYVYIEEFKRYYFITNITSLNNNLWELSLKVDVLFSFKDETLNNTGFISRNEFAFNKYIEDNLINCRFDKGVTEFEPEEGESVNVHFGKTAHNNNYVITCMNNQTSHVATTTAQLDGVLPSVSLSDTGVNLPLHSYVIGYNYIYAILKGLALDDTKATYVSSLMIYPFEVPTQTGAEIDFYLGDSVFSVDGANMKVKYMANEQSTYLICADFTLTGTHQNFLDYEPYTRYEIYLPYCGWFNLNAEQILDKRLKVVYVLNHRTGTAQVSVIDTTSKKLILTTTAQIGVNYPINTTNARELATQHNANALNLGVNLVASGISTAGGLLTENPLAVAGGVMSGARSIANYISSESQLFERAQCHILDGNMGLYNPQKVRIRKTLPNIVNYTTEYFSVVGRPLNVTAKLNLYSGYTEVLKIHLENMGIATSGEIDEIENLLHMGVIL